MKLITLILMTSLFFGACTDDNSTQINGEFIYVESQNAAVIKGDSFIYGIVYDAKAQELSKEVEALKKNQYDMIPVSIKGIISENKKSDGWEKVVKIKEIIKISGKPQ